MVHIFIVNSYAGKGDFAAKLRDRLSKIDGLNYYVFNSRYAGHEKELAKKITKFFGDEKIRIYSCGGSGTARNILSGLDNLGEIEFAFFPCGFTNDFIKVFGNKQEYFHNIDNLINGKIMEVDYLKTNHGISLNTFSLGIDSDYLSYYYSFGIVNNISNAFLHFLCLIRAILNVRCVSYDLQFDDQDLSGVYSEVIFANGKVLGGNLNLFENSIENDGIGSTMVIKTQSRRSLWELAANLIKSDREAINKVVMNGSASRISIRREDGKKFLVNMDGELVEGYQFTGEFIKRGLKLVVPKELFNE